MRLSLSAAATIRRADSEPRDKPAVGPTGAGPAALHRRDQSSEQAVLQSDHAIRGATNLKIIRVLRFPIATRAPPQVATTDSECQGISSGQSSDRRLSRRPTRAVSP